MFFVLRCCFSEATLIYYHKCFCLSTTFFQLVFGSFCLNSWNAEGGIWTLAPLLTTYSLSRGAPSTTWVLLHSWLKRISFYKQDRYSIGCTGKRSKLKLRIFRHSSGESGIRTHAPLRTNGFQDRLVMTTSISLQSALSNVLLQYTR